MAREPERPPLIVVAQGLSDITRAAGAARVLSAPLLINANPVELDDPAFALVYSTQGVALHHTGRKAAGPVKVELLSGAQEHRRRFGGGKGQMIARAVGLKAGVMPSVVDLTAGLGRDGFVLACLGAQVRWVERSPLVFRLLQDGLERAWEQLRAQPDPEVASILNRLSLIEGEGGDYLAGLAARGEPPEVIYLDPMFPPRVKSADVKKEMRAFHELVGRDEDAGGLLEQALDTVRFRVVVKRPRKAPDLGGRAPSHRIEGKASRFDVYTRAKMPDRWPAASLVEN